MKIKEIGEDDDSAKVVSLNDEVEKRESPLNVG